MAAIFCTSQGFVW